MHTAAADENDVARQKKIPPPLNGVMTAPRKKKHYLAEIMVVIIDLRSAVILQMEQTKVLLQIPAPFRMLFHTFASLTASFAKSIA